VIPLAVLAAAAPPPPELPSGFPATFPLIFAGMWLGITHVLGLVSGHLQLLARFPPADERREETFLFASGMMRWVSFSSCMHVGIGTRGLHLAANGVFRPLLWRGVPCIPWSEVRLVRAQASGLLARFMGTKIEVRSLGLRFRVNGRPGRAIEEKLATLGITPLASAGGLVRGG
jgi:hypothetical protein